MAVLFSRNCEEYLDSARATVSGVRAAVPTAHLSARLADPLHRPGAIVEIALACREGVAAGARALGICERTLWRWRATVPELAHELDRARGVL